jgi:CRP-like cAMP-binding protein
MDSVQRLIERKLLRHSDLGPAEKAELANLDIRTRSCAPGEDVVRQGDRPKHAVVVLKGVLGRYHTIASGSRQYLSLHIVGDFPDAQGLFLDVMDHSVCAMGEAEIGLISHKELQAAFQKRPLVGFVFWRETLIDAAIFRQAITNNGKRSPVARLAHFFCEQFFRAEAAELTEGNRCDLPLSQQQLADTLGLALISITRSLRRLRALKLVVFGNRSLRILNWQELAEIAQFDPSYLHLKSQRVLWQAVSSK